MKKIIIGVFIGIAICIISFVIYLNCFMFVPDEGGMENINEIKFGEYKASEWEEMIKNFYNDTYGSAPKSIKCYYNDDNNFIAEIYYYEPEISEEIHYFYVFEPETLYARGEGSECIDFINGKHVTVKVDFSNNEYLAIGYVTDLTEDEFIEKNFYYTYPYYDLTELNLCSVKSKEKGEYNTFVIIPKSKDIKISLCECSINFNDGELKAGKELIKNCTEPLKVYTNYFEETTTPKYCIIYEYNGISKTVPIVFSGMDGLLDLTESKGTIKDISIY